MKTDKKRVLKFASIQGETAKKVLSSQDIESLNNVIFFHDGQTFHESEAIGKIFSLLEFPYSLLGSLILLIPFLLSNFVYRFIAKNRYKIWGERDTCRLPTSEERLYFLD